MIKVESVWEVEGGTGEGWDSYTGTPGIGKRFVSSAIRASGGSFGQASWMLRQGESGLSPPQELDFPYLTVHA